MLPYNVSPLATTSTSRASWWRRWRWWYLPLAVVGFMVLAFVGTVAWKVNVGLRAAELRALNPYPQLVIASDPTKVSRSTAAIRGAADAPITIVEFGDFECPYSKASLPILREVLAEYSGQVRVIFRHFPLSTIHENATAAAVAATCAEVQGKFWPYHDQLYLYQNAFDEAGLTTAATTVGLDVGKWQQCRSLGLGQRVVDADLADGRALGVRGTPTWFINNRKVEGALNVQQFRAIIDGALSAN